MTWKEIKDALEGQGLQDDDEVASIEIDCSEENIIIATNDEGERDIISE
jgi:hypothetical protein